MITNNYKSILQAIFSGKAETVKDYTGVTGSLSPSTSGFASPNNSFATQLTAAKLFITNSDDHGGVFFGRGTTPASAEDYELESEITGGLTIVNPMSYQRLAGADGKITYTATYTLTNTTAANIMIGEIGLYVPTYCKASTGSGSSKRYILADHTVLEQPLTIPAGEVRALTYNIVFDMSFV